MLVFAQDRSSPVLAVTAPDQTLPLRGTTGVQDRFGGTLTSDLLPGYRLSAGRYFGPNKRLGIGARGYGIYDGSEEFAVSSADGTTSIGVPFFNLNRNPLNPPATSGAGEDSYIVAGRTVDGPDAGTAPDDISTGSLSASEALKMVGADLSGYVLLTRTGSSRFDLVAGYTYNQLRNRIRLNTTSTNLYTGDAIANGTVLATRDDFAADNRFNGAHLGVLSSVVRKRVSLSTLAKLSFGNMTTRTAINGSSTVTPPAGAASNLTGGIFAQSSNIGVTKTDHFAFLPEMGIKLAYQLRPNVQLTAGYTALFWSDVALAGEQIDRTINLAGTGRPLATNKLSTFWMQSVDLGLSMAY
jgi:hypothetical protein